MRWNRPLVEDFMTRAPVVVAPGDPLEAAAHAMITHRVRHLVVCDEGSVVGVVSQRDVYYTQAHREDAAEVARVSDAMTPFVYAVRPDAPVEEVARDLADAKYGAVVVTIGDAPVGVFTSTDALRMLSEVLGDLRRAASTRSPAGADDAGAR